jgi:ABC-type polysaccharide/polyol phosphate transport system ATPase subunit
VGFNPDLTARENVVINAVMLGLSRREARRRFDEIIAFAELEEFVDLKLMNYSSGMSVRLGFSVAIPVDAEVLLVDEVLAVGATCRSSASASTSSNVCALRTARASPANALTVAASTLSWTTRKYAAMEVNRP